MGTVEDSSGFDLLDVARPSNPTHVMWVLVGTMQRLKMLLNTPQCTKGSPHHLQQ